jgi:hypothetical protein
MNAEMIGGHSTTQDKDIVAILQSFLILAPSSADQDLIHMGSQRRAAVLDNHRIPLAFQQGVITRDIEGFVID